MAETPPHSPDFALRQTRHIFLIYSHCSTPTRRMQSSSVHSEEVARSLQIQTFGLTLVSSLIRQKYLGRVSSADTSCIELTVCSSLHIE